MFGFDVEGSKYTYLTLPILSYALALYTFIQNGKSFDWQNDPDQDGRLLVVESLEYLLQTGDISQALQPN